MHKLTIMTVIISCCIFSSCSLLGMLTSPNVEKEKKDRFLSATGHEMLSIFAKEDRLGYLYEKGFFTRKVWGGKVSEQHIGQNIELSYSREDFDKLRATLGDRLEVGPGLENIHYIVLRLEDVKKYELIDPQPLIEYMSREDSDLLKKPFVYSMIKVSKMSIEAYQKFNGDIGAVYKICEGVSIKGGSGLSSTKEESQAGYNVFVGYKLMDGTNWIRDFQDAPKVDLVITSPANNVLVKSAKGRVKGNILQYNLLPEEYQNKLQIYMMVHDESEDHWLLQSEARIDTKGAFEAYIELGTLKEGDNHRYSIAAFATYFKINRDVNTVIPILPFNKGKYVINVTRRDEF